MRNGPKTRGLAARAASERKYRELVECSADVISRSDAEGVYRYVSPACIRVYGWTPEQMVGRPVRDFLHPDDVTRHADVRALLAAGADRQVADFRVAHAEDGWVWSEMSYSVQRNADGSIRAIQAAARNISDRAVAADVRRIADEQFRSTFDDAPIGMALVDLDGRCLRVNPALCAILGYPAEELSGRAFHDITHPDDLEADVELFGQLLAGRVPSYRLAKRYLRADGATVWAQLSVSLVRDVRGNARHLVSQVEDITDRKRLERELERLATRDDLTGLHNRRFFEQALEAQLRRVERYRDQAAVLMLDLDDFKSVNDTLGHHAGDQLLKHVGKIVSERLRSSDVLARLGGDEFAVLLPHANDETAADVAAALQGEFARRPARIEGHDILAGASIGVSVLAAGDSIDDALRRADRAMYRAKRACRPR